LVGSSSEGEIVEARVLHKGGVYDALFTVGLSSTSPVQPRDDWTGGAVSMLADRLIAKTDLRCVIALAPDRAIL
jgi:hypothetical protein